jgi:hypothetical protein
MSINSVAAVAEVPKEEREKPRSVRNESSKSARSANVSRAGKGTTKQRYFLAGDGGDGTPSLGRELESESEAIIAAFREQKRFLVLTEWQVGTKISGSIPQLVKEGVARA